MDRKARLLVGGALTLALVGGGTGVAVAAGGGDAETPITGRALAAASAAAAATRRLRAAWDAYRSGGVPAQLVTQMSRDLDTLAATVAARNPAGARAAALRVAQNDLDLQLQHRPVVEIDLARFRLWARQLLVDTAAGDPGAVAGDVTTMEWVRDRVRHALDPATAARVDDQLRGLRAAADREDVPAAAKAAPALLKTLAPA